MKTKYENYSVDKEGNVYSDERQVVYSDGRVFNYKKKMLSPAINTNGYYTVAITVNKIATSKTVHRMIAETFIPNPEDKCCVNHIDGNKLNNNVSNLEWVNKSENAVHSFDVLNQKRLKGKDNYHSIEVIGINKETNEKIVYESMHLAKEDGFNPSHISKCINGKLKQHKGYVWIRSKQKNTVK